MSETGATAAAGRVGTLRSYIDGLTGKTVTIRTAYVTQGRAPGTARSQGGFDTSGGAFAAGGAVFGAGTSTSDSINARLSHNEHVWTAREVEAVGGHAAVYALRAAALAGRLPKFADGGPFMSTSRATQYAARPAPMTLSPVVRVNTPAADLAPLQASIAALGDDIRNMRFEMDGQVAARSVSKYQRRSRENGGAG